MDPKTNRIVFDTPWFNVEQIDLESSLPSFDGPFYRINSADGVIILPITPEKKLLMVRQYRPAIAETTLEFPSGTVDEGETPLQAAERELLEETGYRCEKIHYLIKGRILLNRYNCFVHAFLGECATPEPNKQPESGITVETTTLIDFKELVFQHDFPNLTGLSLILLAEWKLGINLE